MKKTLLVLLLSACLTSFAHAQEIHINPFSVQGTDLTVSTWGVNSVAFAQHEIALKKKNQPWMTVQSTTLPLPGTGFLGLHVVSAVSALHNGDIYRAFGTLVDVSIMRTCTVYYKVRKRCNAIAGTTINQRTAKIRLIDALPQGIPMVKTISGTTVGQPEPRIEDVYLGDINSVVDLGNDLELAPITSEEAQEIEDGIETGQLQDGRLIEDASVSSISQVKITSGLQTIWFDNAAEGLNFIYEVFDLSGKSVTRGHSSPGSSRTVTILGLAQGNYIVKIVDEKTGEAQSKQVPIQY